LCGEAAREPSGRVLVRIARDEGETVEHAQQVVLEELQGTSVRVLHRYLNSPFLAVEGGADVLDSLARSRKVIAVSRDFELVPHFCEERR